MIACGGETSPNTASDSGPSRTIDATPRRDATPVDAATVDAGTLLDASTTDAAQSDATTTDAEVMDAFAPDAIADSGVQGTFAIGGVVSGLTGTLIIANAGADALTITLDGPFAFATELTDLTAYSVEVQQYPTAPLQHCAVIGGAGRINAAAVTDVRIECMALAPYPSNGAGWGDWVRNDGMDMPCDPDNAGLGCEACIHGGERRMLHVPDRASCAGLSAVDSAGAFDWVCDDTNGRAVFMSTRLAGGSRLSSLIDFAQGTWAGLSLVVSDGATPVYTSAPQAWWSTPVEVRNQGLFQGASAERTVYVINADSAASFDIGMSSIAIVVAPGVTLSASGTRSGAVMFGSGRDFLWLEGRIDAQDKNIGVELRGARCAMLDNLSISNAGFRNIHILGGSRSVRLTSTTVSNSGGEGVLLAGAVNNRMTGFVVRDLSVSMNTGVGLDMIALDDSVVESVSSTGDVGGGVRLRQGDGTALREIIARSAGAHGVEVSSTDRVSLERVEVTGSAGTGVVIDDVITATVASVRVDGADIGVDLVEVTDGRVSGLSISNALQSGLRIRGLSSTDTFVERVRVDSSGTGILVDGAARGLRLSEAYCANNTIGVQLGATDITVDGVSAFSNAGPGLRVDSCLSCRIADITSVANTIGVSVGPAPGTTFLDVTAANNAGAGVTITGSGRNTLVNIASVGNGGAGLSITGSGRDNVVANLVAVDNAGTPVELSGSTTVMFTGVLRLSDVNPPCTIGPASAGLDGVTCAPNGSSDAVLTSVAAGPLRLVGPVTMDDTMNSDDVGGAAMSANIRDWVRFESGYRGWSLETGPGPCTAGQSCRIFDASGLAADLVLRDVSTAPTGNDVLVHFWEVIPPPNAQVVCDIEAPGSLFVDPVIGCQTTLLRAAYEVRGDGIGNDNTVCESDEVCVIAPNVGSYQGHGGIIAAGRAADGTLIGIELRRASNNGR